MLVVDDDLALGKVLVGLLSQAKLVARHASSAEEALGLIGSSPCDLVITDLKMPRMDGLSLVRELKARVPDVPVILLTAHGSIPVAVEAMRAGASDFLTKPFDRDEILYTVDKALKLGERALTAPPDPGTRAGSWLGSSQPMTEVADLVRRAARASANVLIRGESGTGKEVVARSIHAESSRKEGPFVAVNCAALPEQLLESELFGYEKGAFTGAVARRPGRVEIARGGTLFLDEIGDVPIPAQAKLLRLLQEREYQPLGSTRTERADVRFLAATHRDLEAMIHTGQFREDLYYRLNVIPITLPPLRDRPGDVAELARRFLDTVARESGRAGVTLDEAAVARLARYNWPGNVRELMCVVERLIVFTDGSRIEDRDVERELDRIRRPVAARTGGGSDGEPAAAHPEPRPENASLAERRLEAERDAVLEALSRAGQNRTQAARLLGVSRRTLYKRLEALGIASHIS
ncbi:MAG: sigma-54-dependent Fis family transcriptional regulator [Myxococcales bacterium]|nr:sigma-54-dependent Fis family transcriptional regulator [Myxococcales bacterium]